MNLDDKAYEDFNNFMSGKVIPGLILLADKHNYDRDSFIGYAAAAMEMLSEIATFKNYKLRNIESEDKNEKKIL